MNLNLDIKEDIKFQFAKATNTRMMGVVGLVCEWKTAGGRVITQIFHLDYESYGIDGFYHFTDAEAREIETTVLGVTGGLGGDFVEVSYEEYVFLIKSAYIVDPTSVEALVDFEYFTERFDDLYAGLSINEEIALYKRLCPKLENEIEVINYFLMRCVGNDYPPTMMLWTDGEIDPTFEIGDGSYSLLKNTIRLESTSNDCNLYRSESLIDFEDHYKLLITEVSVNPKTLEIAGARVEESLDVSSIEASFNLNRPEYMLIMTVNDAFFERRFAEQNPEMMKYDYYNGQLYTEFNPDNSHVRENPYFLNGDLFALYFFTRHGQLVVGSLKPQGIETVNQAFLKNHAYDESLSFICEVKTDYPVLYSFMNSAYDNIFDFFENWRE